jgi:hypothetical protein
LFSRDFGFRAPLLRAEVQRMGGRLTSPGFMMSTATAQARTDPRHIQVTEFPRDGRYRHPDGTVFISPQLANETFGISDVLPGYYRDRPEPNLGRPVRWVYLFIDREEHGRFFYAEADLAHETPSSFPQEWTDPDGTEWAVREITPVSWPRLLHIRVEVTPDNQHVKIPGKVRCKGVPLLRPSSRNPTRIYPRDVKVYHKADGEELADAPDVEAAFKAAERQQATIGKHKDKWFVSPGLVARRLDIHPSLVPKYAREGVPWMPEIPTGCHAGQRPKPITQAFKNGHYGQDDVDFWLESDDDERYAGRTVDSFAKAKEDVPLVSPDGTIKSASGTITIKNKAGYSTIKADDVITINGAAEAGDISESLARQKIRDDELWYGDAILKFTEKVGETTFTFTAEARVIKKKDTQAHRKAGYDNPVPPEKATVNQIAHIFKKSDAWVLGLCSKPLPELDRKKPTADMGDILVLYKDQNGTRISMRTRGYHLLKSEWKRIWNGMYPDKPWPLDDPNEQTPDGTNGTQTATPTTSQPVSPPGAPLEVQTSIEDSSTAAPSSAATPREPETCTPETCTPGTPQEVGVTAPAASREPAGETSQQDRGGRPRSTRVNEVQEYVYKRWIKGDKLASIRMGAETRFGKARAPKEDSHVSTMAQRYAEKHTPPLPTNRPS